MGARPEVDQPPSRFLAAVEQLRAARLRPEVLLTEVPAPQRIAPFATAVAADVLLDGADVGSGRLVLLHDPDGNHSWQGCFRFVSFVRADLDPEMVRDPVLSAVAWSWLTEAWQGHGIDALSPSGTVTVVVSEGFGGIAADGLTAQVEVRASWTPADGAADLSAHVEAWGDLVGAATGLPPVPPGVAALPLRRGGPR